MIDLMEHEIAFRSSVMMFASGSDWSYWLSMERLNQVVKPLYDFATVTSYIFHKMLTSLSGSSSALNCLKFRILA